MRSNENTLNYTRLRKRSDHLFFKNIIKLERGQITFKYLDSKNEKYGGIVKANVTEFNINRFLKFNYTLHGYFNNSEIVLGRFSKDITDSDFNNNDTVKEITNNDISETSLVSRFKYSLDSNGLLYYTVQVNQKYRDHLYELMQDSETELIPQAEFNLKEKLYHALP